MSTPFTVQCTHCSAKLKLKSAAAVGKRAKCPKCQQAFVVEAPPTDDADLFGTGNDDPFGGGFDDFGSGGDDPYGGFDELGGATPAAVSSKKKSGTKGAKKKGKGKKGGGGDWQQPALIGGGALLGLAAIVGVVWGVTNMMPASSGWVSWLPDNTETVIRVRVSNVWNSRILGPVRDNPMVREQLQNFEQNGGLAVSDVESVTVGIAGTLSFDGRNTPPSATVLRMRRQVSPETMLNPIASQVGGQVETATHGGATYYRISVGGQTQAAYAPDSNTIVLADEPMLQRLIDGGGRCAAASRFRSFDLNNDVVVAFAPSDLTKLDTLMPVPQMPGRVSNSQAYQGGALGVNLGNEIDILLSILCNSSAQARAEANNARNDIEQSGAMFAQDPVVKSIMDSVTATANGQMLQVSARVPATAVDQLVASMELGLGMMMLGGGADPFGGLFGSMGMGGGAPAMPSFGGGPAPPAGPGALGGKGTPGSAPSASGGPGSGSHDDSLNIGLPANLGGPGSGGHDDSLNIGLPANLGGPGSSGHADSSLNLGLPADLGGGTGVGTDLNMPGLGADLSGGAGGGVDLSLPGLGGPGLGGVSDPTLPGLGADLNGGLPGAGLDPGAMLNPGLPGGPGMQNPGGAPPPQGRGRQRNAPRTQQPPPQQPNAPQGFGDPRGSDPRFEQRNGPPPGADQRSSEPRPGEQRNGPPPGIDQRSSEPRGGEQRSGPPPEARDQRSSEPRGEDRSGPPPGAIPDSRSSEPRGEDRRGPPPQSQPDSRSSEPQGERGPPPNRP